MTKHPKVFLYSKNQHVKRMITSLVISPYTQSIVEVESISDLNEAIYTPNDIFLVDSIGEFSLISNLKSIESRINNLNVIIVGESKNQAVLDQLESIGVSKYFSVEDSFQELIEYVQASHFTI